MDEPVTRKLTGKCFCGAVHYEVADEFVYAANCHCSNCRCTTGSAFKPFAGIGRDKFRLTTGDDRLLIYGDENGHDAHCGHLRLARLFVGPRWRLRPCRHGDADGRSRYSAERTYLRRFKGAVVHDYRRPAAIS